MKKLKGYHGDSYADVAQRVIDRGYHLILYAASSPTAQGYEIGRPRTGISAVRALMKAQREHAIAWIQIDGGERL